LSSQDVDTRIILVLLLVLLLALCTVGWCALRLTILLRRPGSLQCSVRAKNARGWRTGVLILGPRALEWFSTRSFLPVPQRVFQRAGFHIVGHKLARNDLTVAHVEYLGEALDIAMSPQSFAGLVSWIDSAPPAEEPTYI